MSDKRTNGAPLCSPTGGPKAPWETIKNEELGVSANVTEKIKTAELWGLQAPWTKNGGDRKKEMNKVRSTWDVRKERRAENWQRSSAEGKIPTNDISEQTRRTTEFRAKRFEERKTEESSKQAQRAQQVKAANMKKSTFVQERRVQEEQERKKVQSDIEHRVSSRKKLVAENRKIKSEQASKPFKEGLETVQKIRDIRASMRQEEAKVQEEIKREIKPRQSATMAREERIRREKDAKRVRNQQDKRVAARSAWAMEEKEEARIAQQDSIRQAAERAAQRRALASAEKQDSKATQGIVKQKAKLLEQNRRKIKGEEKRAWAQERIEKRNEALQQLESHHLQALERKQVRQQEFRERNEVPLERRSEFGSQRKQQGKADLLLKRSQILQEQEATRARRAQLRQQDRANQSAPFVLR